MHISIINYKGIPGCDCISIKFHRVFIFLLRSHLASVQFDFYSFFGSAYDPSCHNIAHSRHITSNIETPEAVGIWAAKSRKLMHHLIAHHCSPQRRRITLINLKVKYEIWNSSPDASVWKHKLPTTHFRGRPCTATATASCECCLFAASRFVLRTRIESEKKRKTGFKTARRQKHMLGICCKQTMIQLVYTKRAQASKRTAKMSAFLHSHSLCFGTILLSFMHSERRRIDWPCSEHRA